MNIYLDNAATSFPKPSIVSESMFNIINSLASNPGRGAYNSALTGTRSVYECRDSIANFFGFDKAENVVFTPNITYALNTLIHSIVKPGWHVITSEMDHNSVLRPLNTLKAKGVIELDIAKCDSSGKIILQDFIDKINNNTKLVVLSHASNVFGTIQPLDIIGKICLEKGIYFIVDSAQSAGHIPVNFNDLNSDAIAFTGHKSLLGPQGIGGFIINDKLNEIASPIFSGGTGSNSSDLLQPSFLPDKFEIGTLNTPGIVGLNSALNYLKTEEYNNLLVKEKNLFKYFLSELDKISNLIIYGTKNSLSSTPTVSINMKSKDTSELSYILDKNYGIMTRTGLHCAPLAHKSMGTFPSGTVRFSLGIFNNVNEINYVLESLDSIAKEVIL
ncbi:aminotransferase class V-fold PLP-dependent enzyme [Clostridium paridis]|uniref:cysteine desulfurase n=1 Tax=Clostridium paridis TaxID=2803863 RepID=A0A937FAE8_9CLOT|nr:aminotransferase class V-fold PLP-dependent enzyme [Clostridium paridis]MBL4930500.1 aminotransferase class V-fold PLP-dependent enzyme [Clostridium paridis]